MLFGVTTLLFSLTTHWSFKFTRQRYDETRAKNLLKFAQYIWYIIC